MEQQKGNDNPGKSQAEKKRLTDAELRRVARIFELLIQIDQRKKKVQKDATRNK